MGVVAFAVAGEDALDRNALAIEVPKRSLGEVVRQATNTCVSILVQGMDRPPLNFPLWKI